MDFLLHRKAIAEIWEKWKMSDPISQLDTSIQFGYFNSYGIQLTRILKVKSGFKLVFTTKLSGMSRSAFNISAFLSTMLLETSSKIEKDKEEEYKQKAVLNTPITGFTFLIDEGELKAVPEENKPVSSVTLDIECFLSKSLVETFIHDTTFEKLRTAEFLLYLKHSVLQFFNEDEKVISLLRSKNIMMPDYNSLNKRRHRTHMEKGKVWMVGGAIAYIPLLNRINTLLDEIDAESAIEDSKWRNFGKVTYKANAPIWTEPDEAMGFLNSGHNWDMLNLHNMQALSPISVYDEVFDRRIKDDINPLRTLWDVVPGEKNPLMIQHGIPPVYNSFNRVFVSIYDVGDLTLAEFINKDTLFTKWIMGDFLDEVERELILSWNKSKWPYSPLTMVHARGILIMLSKWGTPQKIRELKSLVDKQLLKNSNVLIDINA